VSRKLEWCMRGAWRGDSTLFQKTDHAYTYVFIC